MKTSKILFWSTIGTFLVGNSALGQQGNIPAANQLPAQGNQISNQGVQDSRADQSGGIGNQQNVGGSNQPTNQFGSANGLGANPWFADQAIQQQLNLTPQQSQSLNRAYSIAYSRYQEAVARIPSSLNSVQRQERLLSLQARFDQMHNRSLGATLTDSQSVQRFNQLNTQFQGFNAFNNPQLQQNLNLTPRQMQRFNELASQYSQRFQQLQEQGIDPQVQQQQFQALQQQAQQQIGSVLTPQQQQNWPQMVGENFNFPLSAFNGNNSPDNQVDPHSQLDKGRMNPNAGANQAPGGGTDQMNQTGVVPSANGAAGNTGVGGVGTGGSASAGGSTGPVGGGGGAATNGGGSN